MLCSKELLDRYAKPLLEEAEEVILIEVSSDEFTENVEVLKAMRDSDESGQDFRRMYQHHIADVTTQLSLLRDNVEALLQIGKESIATMEI